QLARHQETVQKDLVTWRLVIEGEAGTVVADPGQPFRKRNPRAARRLAVARYCLTVDGVKRIGGPRGLEIGENQFLMRLLMVQAQGHHRADRRVFRPEDAGNVLVHVGTIAVDLGHGRSGQEAPLRPWPARPDGLVVRIEKKAEVRMESPVTREARLEDKR